MDFHQDAIYFHEAKDDTQLPELLSTGCTWIGYVFLTKHKIIVLVDPPSKLFNLFVSTEDSIKDALSVTGI